MLARSGPNRRLIVGITWPANGADAEHRVEDAEGELVELELEAADHRQQGADGDARHEEAEPAGEDGLELAELRTKAMPVRAPRRSPRGAAAARCSADRFQLCMAKMTPM
jgi:hypothetical protein